MGQRESAANLFLPVGSGNLVLSGALALLGLLRLSMLAWMLAGEAGLKVFDLLLDFLFALAGLKEDVIRVSPLLLELSWFSLKWRSDVLR